jgi:hypothetical protein
MTWGPWSPACCGHEQRVLQLRTLRTIAYLRLGPDHPWISELRAAETDPMAFVRALEGFDQVPALRRRQILATFASITWTHGPTRRSNHD